MESMEKRFISADGYGIWVTKEADPKIHFEMPCGVHMKLFEWTFIRLRMDKMGGMRKSKYIKLPSVAPPKAVYSDLEWCLSRSDKLSLVKLINFR